MAYSVIFFFKQKTAYELRISDWSSDVCSSDLGGGAVASTSRFRIFMTSSDPMKWHGTTILAVRKDGRIVVAGDGQVTAGNTVMKAGARKVRRPEERRGGKAGVNTCRSRW